MSMEGIDVNAITSQDIAPLYYAVFSHPSKYDMMRRLVNAGADIENRDVFNTTAACYSVTTEYDYKDQPMPIEVQRSLTL